MEEIMINLVQTILGGLLLSLILFFINKFYIKWKNRLSFQAKDFLRKLKSDEMVILETNETGEFLRINLNTSNQEDIFEFREVLLELINNNYLFQESKIRYKLTVKGKNFNRN